MLHSFEPLSWIKIDGSHMVHSLGYVQGVKERFYHFFVVSVQISVNNLIFGWFCGEKLLEPILDLLYYFEWLPWIYGDGRRMVPSLGYKQSGYDFIIF